MGRRKKRRVRRQSIDARRTSPAPTTTAERLEVTTEYSGSDTLQAFDFECPLCGGGKGRANISTRTGEWVISCWSCSQSSYLFELAEAILPVGQRDAYALKEDPRKYLAPYIRRNVRHAAIPDPLPSADDIRAWCQMRRNDPDAMRYLLAERGLNKRVVERARLGYDGRAVTIPIYDVRTRELVNLRRRYWPNPPASGGKYRGLAGRPATVYPFLPDGPLILVAGEFDALVLLSHGLPGISVTTGAATRWRQEWNWIAKGRRMVVMYDADPREQEQARDRAAELRRAGADAWPVRLTEAGLRGGEDVTDFFTKRGGSKAALLSLINRERKIKRRAA